MARLIKGKDVAEAIYGELRARIAALKDNGVRPCLGVIIIGDDPNSPSEVYVRNKEKKCKELGIMSITMRLPSDVTQEELMATVRELNDDPKYHGVLVQSPLPAPLDEQEVINAISPDKDVDCFNPANIGRILAGEPDFLPATPAGIQQLLVRNGIETSGRHVVIVGRSSIVGKPLAAMMVQKGVGADATVTVVHSSTKDLPSITRMADILVVATGKPGFVTGDMVKEGAVVIDVGTNTVQDPTSEKGTRLVGDVDFDSVEPKASAITPVPGGVGPMTICMLMANTVKAAEKASGVKE